MSYFFFLNSLLKIFIFFLCLKLFCNFLNDTILNDLLSCRKKYGLNIGRTQNYYLFCEQCHNILSSNCSKLDRYGYCCSILDKEKKIFIGRDPNFPW